MTRRLLIAGGLLGLGALALFGQGWLGADVGAGPIEKPQLRIGYLKQTDAAPIIVAKELGYFRAEGLDVTIEPQSDVTALERRLLSGGLDGSQAPVALALAARAGYGTPADLIVPLILGVNGNAVTLSREVWADIRPALPADPDGRAALPIRAEALPRAIEAFARQRRHLNFGVVSALSSHNYQLRYWLAAGGIRPGYFTAENRAGTAGAQVNIWPLPAARLTATLEAGTIQGFAAGEPWNQRAASLRLGVPVISSAAIRTGGAEKAFVLSRSFAAQNPNTARAVLRALIRASLWLDADGGGNREIAARMLAAPEYVGLSAPVIALSLSGQMLGADGKERLQADPPRFFHRGAGLPYYSEAVWYLTQMRRWGQIEGYRSDAWYAETARAVFRPELYLQAAQELVARGRAQPGDFDWQGGSDQTGPTAPAIDGRAFDPQHPNAYLDGFLIGLKGHETAAEALRLQN